jgi:starch synthase
MAEFPINKEPPRVLFATPEAGPLVKTGGLGDVAGVLPGTLARQGLDVRVLLPGYAHVLEILPWRESIAHVAGTDGFPPFDLIGTSLAHGVPALILDCPSLYRREGGPYQDPSGRDWPDNARRFGLLSRVAALLATDSSPLAWQPDILHCNDWSTGLAPAYLHFAAGDKAATVMSIHNLAYQGIFPPHWTAELGLPAHAFQVNGVEYYGNLSFLKAGVYYADHLTTVSPTYATEIQHPDMGFGMHGLLAARRAHLTGILNGIDATVWDPAYDPLIPQRYDIERLELKARNKLALRNEAELELVPELPLFAVISRFVYQKGLDLLLTIAPQLVGLPAQLVLFGSGEPELIRGFEALARAHPGAVSMRAGFDEHYAHLIEAGADAFLMPSRYEPCGLNQMYSQRYGTLPVVHATGGLADSVIDATPEALADGNATGFVFHSFTAEAFMHAVGRAATAYRDPTTWRALQQNAMRCDFSWDHAAHEYRKVYESVLSGT